MPKTTKRELLDLMNEGYPDGFMASYYDGRGEAIPLSGDMLGDGLARFLVGEASDLFEEDSTPEANKQRIVQALLNAIRDIESVIQKLE